MTVRVDHNDLFAFLAAMTLAVWPAAPGLAGGVNAGTLIESAAKATFDGPGGTTTLSSNTVSLMVDEVLDVTVTSRDAGPIAAAPGRAVLTFELANPGNGPEAYLLAAEPGTGGSDFDANVIGIAIDANANGIYDPGVDELLPSPQTTALVEPDQMLTVFVIIDIPAGTADGQHGDARLIAVATTGTGAPGTTFASAGTNGADAVVGTSGGSNSATGKVQVGITTVNLVKSASLADGNLANGAVAGAKITFAIVAQVVGAGEVSDLAITDAIPDGTTYAPGSLMLNGSPLTDAPSDDAGQADAGGISVALGTVPGGATHNISFAVTVNRDADRISGNKP